MSSISNPRVDSAITTTSQAAITGFTIGVFSVTFIAASGRFVANTHAAGIPLTVMHRVTAIASDGLEDFRHDGAAIAILAVMGSSSAAVFLKILANVVSGAS